MLRFDGLATGFGEGPNVVQDVDLEIRAGEFVTVLGPSGCGKSTILNVACGLLKARAGTVSFAGRPLVGVNTSVGYMTQGDTLLPWRTVADNVALPLRLRGVSRQVIRERVASSLDMLELGDSARRYPAQLSGGMKRRALLARSMIYEPAMLVMDEPFAALDAQLRTQLQVELRRTVADARQTVLFVTHDIDEAVLVSDRVLVLGGRPAAPIADIAIDLGPDRDAETIRFDERFRQLEQRVHAALVQARPAEEER
ncbi:nitrate ABC transporter ATPase (plasmid) [Pseudonocardia sp. EC080610-09]|nr:nitrate ABC transporter ATPase [Pseudonocardia sp. EC080610-09]ALL85709.1 nitrate ABC transporter ATPase [Pseudonocardia sp. EC080619-01]